MWDRYATKWNDFVSNNAYCPGFRALVLDGKNRTELSLADTVKSLDTVLQARKEYTATLPTTMLELFLVGEATKLPPMFQAGIKIAEGRLVRLFDIVELLMYPDVSNPTGRSIHPHDACKSHFGLPEMFSNGNHGMNFIKKDSEKYVHFATDPETGLLVNEHSVHFQPPLLTVRAVVMTTLVACQHLSILAVQDTKT